MVTGELTPTSPVGILFPVIGHNGLFIFESPLTNPSMEWSDCSIIQGDVNYDGNLNILDIVQDCKLHTRKLLNLRICSYT